jgi:periplasmic protein TonB
MGRFEHSSELFHRISYPAAERSPLRLHRRPRAAASSIVRRERPAPVDLKEDDQIFHSLIASGNQLKPRSQWTTFASFVVQVLLLAGVAAIPLLQVEPLPKREERTRIYLSPLPQAARTSLNVSAPKPAFARTQPRASIPAPATTPEQHPAPVVAPIDTATGTEGGFPDGVSTGVAGGSSIIPVPVKAPEPAPVKRIRVAARVAEANLIHDVPPQYPPEAGRERIEGTVVLMAVIGTDGSVKDVQVESGPAALAQAAIDAVKQWRYRPYMLNGVPVEIDSRITINFTMSRG